MQIVSYTKNCKSLILFFLMSLFICTLNNKLLFSQELRIKRYEDYTREIDPKIYNSINSLITIRDSCGTIFKILNSSGIINEAIAKLPALERNYDGYLFFNGGENANSFILLNKYFDEISYLIEANSLLVIRFDVSSENIYQLDFALKREKSTFLQDINSISGLFGKFKGEGVESKVGSPEDYKEITLSLESFQNIGPAPSEISLNVKKISITDLDKDAYKLGNFDNIISVTNDKIYYYTKTQINFKNAERKYFGLSVGASVSSSTVKSFETNLSNDNIIKVKKSVATEWKANAILILNIFPGVESEWNPTLKFWKKEFYKDFYNRFSLNVGLQITERPFDKIFFGLGFNLTGAIDLLFGLALNYQPDENSEILISQIQKFEDISQLFPQKYEMGTFLGLSVRVSELVKVL